MIYFGQKWLTGEVYRKLSHEDETLSLKGIGGLMNQLHKTKIELEHSFEHAHR